MTAPVPHPTGKLRFAILCDGTTFAAWQARCLGDLLASGAAEPVLVVIALAWPDAEPTGSWLYRLYDRHWVRPRAAALQPVDLAEELRHLPVVASDDSAAMRRYDLDFILQFADPESGGDVVATAKYGVWAFQDELAQRYCALEVFWQLHRGEPVHRRALTRLTPGRGRRVFHAGSFRIERSCARTADAGLLGSSEWCARMCREIAIATMGEAEPTLPAAPAADRLPTNREFLWFLGTRAAALARGAFRRMFLLEYWNIGIVDAPIERVVAEQQPLSVRWLQAAAKLHYHADPFALPEDPGAVLFEEYSHVTGLGWISSLPLTGDAKPPQRIRLFDRGTHRSYPFLFSAEGAIFCVPESAADRRVELYRAAHFPDQWQRVGTLIEDFPALDSSLFQHEGRWWLLCTSAEPGGEHKLHAWHAADFRGPWQPHPLNPLKCDVSSSRPAGRPFTIDGVLYRPAQDCSATYGGAIVVNRIVTLTPLGFAETPAGRIAPAADSPYPDGLHTVCPLGSVTVIDGKRFVFDLRAPFLKARAARRPAPEPSGSTASPIEASIHRA
jgi:hypothetical protein